MKTSVLIALIGGIAALVTAIATLADVFLQSDDTSKIIHPDSAAKNIKPTAEAGGNKEVKEGDRVVLYGTDSNDEDGTIDSYSWVQTDGPSVSLSGSNTDTLLFNAPSDLNLDTVMTFKLTVRDDDGLIDTDTTNVIVKIVNEAPKVEDQNISTIQSKAISIRLNATDSENDPIRFSLISKPSNGKLSGKAPNLIYIPDENFIGMDSFSFKTDDGKTNSNVAIVDITVKELTLVAKLKDQKMRQNIIFETINLSEEPTTQKGFSDLAVFENYVYIIWEDRLVNPSGIDSLKFSRSINGGSTFISPVELNTKTMYEDVPSNPHIAAYENYVYVVYNSGYHLWLTKSIDNGSTFNPPIPLDTSDSVGTTDVRISASANNIYIVWKEKDNDNNLGNENIFFIRSIDNGNTFSKPVKLTNFNNESSGASKLDMAASGNNVYLLYIGSNAYDPILISSTDNGATFSNPTKISTTAEQKYSAVIAASKNNVYVVWETESDVSIKTSIDNGKTFRKIINLNTGEHNGTGSLFYPKITAYESSVYVFWRANCHEYINKKIGSCLGAFLVASDDNGATFSNPLNIIDRIPQLPIIHGTSNDISSRWREMPIFYELSIDSSASSFYLEWRSNILNSNGNNNEIFLSKIN